MFYNNSNNNNSLINPNNASLTLINPFDKFNFLKATNSESSNFENNINSISPLANTNFNKISPIANVNTRTWGKLFLEIIIIKKFNFNKIKK